jgi:hypothetical protein
MANKVHYGSVRQYANARGKDFRKVYEEIEERGGLKDPNATVIRAKKEVFRIRWN